MGSQPLLSEPPAPLLVSARIAAKAGLGLHDAVAMFRKAVILEALKLEKGNKCRSARRLGLHRNTLARYLKGGW